MNSIVTDKPGELVAGIVLVIAFCAPLAAVAQRVVGPKQEIDAASRQVPIGDGQTRPSNQHDEQLRAPRSTSEEQLQLIANLETDIREAELRDGPNSRDLIEPLTALGRVYLENGEHLLAAAATQRALEVLRYNDGLNTLDQARLVRQLIENAEASGNVEVAWELDQELLTLIKRQPNDLRTARILRDTADKRMKVLERYTAGEYPPEIVLGCYYFDATAPTRRPDGGAPEPNCTSGSARQARRSLFRQAQSFYAESINIILRNGQHASAELPALLMEIVQSSYRFYNPALGERALRYLLAYQTTNSESWQTRIGTLVLIADWELLYSSSRNASESALSTYREAYELLEKHEIDQQSIDEMFAPAQPVVLPAFAPNPFSREAHSRFEYIDVSFEITERGRSENVEILSTTGNVARAAERDLVQLIRRRRFRPRVIDGQFAESTPIVTRYYLSDR